MIKIKTDRDTSERLFRFKYKFYEGVFSYTQLLLGLLPTMNQVSKNKAYNLCRDIEYAYRHDKEFFAENGLCSKNLIERIARLAKRSPDDPDRKMLYTELEYMTNITNGIILSMQPVIDDNDDNIYIVDNVDYYRTQYKFLINWAKREQEYKASIKEHSKFMMDHSRSFKDIDNPFGSTGRNKGIITYGRKL